MAKMMFENLNAIVANTLNDSIKMIDIDELHDSEDNFFDINRIEEFAETILGQGGVKDNLIVRQIENGYEIISGHRRKAAVQYLLDNGKNISRYLPCLVQNYDDDDKMLDMIFMNISSRKISDSEMWKSYEIVDRILKNRKSAGEKFGRVRQKLAEYLGVSAAQVSKMQNVEKNAIEPVKEAISNGEISISTANEIARLSEDEQKEIMQSDLDTISHKDIKKKNDDKKVATNGNFSKDSLTTDDDNEIDTDDFSEDFDSVPDNATKKVATCGNFSKDNLTTDDDNEIDTGNFSEDFDSVSDSATKKVDTCVNFSKDNLTTDDDNEIDTNDFSEDFDSVSDNATKKVATNGNFSKNSLTTDDDNEIDTDDFSEDFDSVSDNATEKVATYGNFSEENDKSPEITLTEFIHEHYFDLESIFTAYISTNDNPEETELLEEFQKLLYQIKENARNKIRFGN